MEKQVAIDEQSNSGGPTEQEKAAKALAKARLLHPESVEKATKKDYSHLSIE